PRRRLGYAIELWPGEEVALLAAGAILRSRRPMGPKPKFRSTLCILLLSLPSLALHAEEDVQKFSIDSTITYEYRRPEGVPFITNLFSDFRLLYTDTIDRRQIPWMLGIAGATLVSLRYDEDVLLGAQWLGKTAGVGNGS